MGDGDADEGDGDERRSDARRLSRFQEIAARLEDEADDREAIADTTAEADRVDSRTDETENTGDHSNQTAADVRLGRAQRTNRDSESETEPDDSWEWIETEDGGETSEETEGDGRADATDAEPTATAETESESREASKSESAVATETSDTESVPERSASTASDQRKGKGRIWDSQTPVDSSSDSGPATDTNASSIDAEGFVDASAESGPEALQDGLALTPGTAILVESSSQDDRTETTCQRLLHDDLDHPRPSVLLVRYQQMNAEELRRIAAEAARTKLVSVGYAQEVPAPLADTVETVKINNPNDITRLGIVVSGTIDQWSGADENISVCYDSINVLLNYKDVKSTFRFLHVLLRTLRRGDAVSHFHVDPLAGDPQSINTLKPLFDEIITIDAMGVTVE